MDKVPTSLVTKAFAFAAAALCVVGVSAYKDYGHRQQQQAQEAQARLTQQEANDAQARQQARDARKQELEKQAKLALQDGRLNGLAVGNYVATTLDRNALHEVNSPDRYRQSQAELDAEIAKVNKNSPKNLKLVARFVQKLQNDRPKTTKAKLEQLQLINLFVNLLIKYDHKESENNLKRRPLLYAAETGSGVCFEQASLKLYLTKKAGFPEKDTWLLYEKPAHQDADGKFIGESHLLPCVRIGDQSWALNNWQKPAQNIHSDKEMADIFAYNSRIDTIESQLQYQGLIPTSEFNADKAYDLVPSDMAQAPAVSQTAPASLRLDIQKIASLGYIAEIKEALTSQHSVVPGTDSKTEIAASTNAGARKPSSRLTQPFMQPVPQ